MKIALFSLLAVLFAGDIWTTVRFLKLPGLKEGNRRLREAFARNGVRTTLVVLKGAVLVYFWLILELTPTIVLGGLAAVYAVVVGRNLYFIRKARA